MRFQIIILGSYDADITVVPSINHVWQTQKSFTGLSRCISLYFYDVFLFFLYAEYDLVVKNDYILSSIVVGNEASEYVCFGSISYRIFGEFDET